MATIKINHADAGKIKTSTDIIVTDPPFDMPASELYEILKNVECNHLVLITTMKQLVEFVNVGEWVISFDFVLDAVTPKKSKNLRQPNYTHSTGAYLIKNKGKSLFNRKKRQRSDTFDNNGYWPTILRAPRERLRLHGMAKSEQALTDVIGSFEVSSVYDPFAGSGTVGLAAMELGINCELTEVDKEYEKILNETFRFFAKKN